MIRFPSVRYNFPSPRNLIMVPTSLPGLRRIAVATDCARRYTCMHDIKRVRTDIISETLSIITTEFAGYYYYYYYYRSRTTASTATALDHGRPIYRLRAPNNTYVYAGAQLRPELLLFARSYTYMRRVYA
jgi:hypothetical protein